MPDQLQPDAPGAVPPPIPDPEQLKPAGLSNRHKRWIYYGVTGVLCFLILANALGTKQPTAPLRSSPTAPGQQQNPTPNQIRDWENNLRQAEAQLAQEQKDRQHQLEVMQAAQRSAALTPDEQLRRAEALSEAETAREQYQQKYGGGQGQYGQGQASQTEAEKEQQAYKSLFADNMVRQEARGASSAEGQSIPHETPFSPATAPEQSPVSPAEAGLKPVEQKTRKPLDFDPAAQEVIWLPEGTVLEAVLTNRLDGDAVGPVDCMITSDVYQPGTRTLLIPQGARVLGEASTVSALGQARLAVAFHRIIVPGLRPYSIPLDKLMPALSQGGDVGLHDKVNSHYAAVFGSSLAIGAIGGLAQIGNGTNGFGYDPSVEFRNGVTQSMAQSSSRILDRFLNRMPTITIREGTRVKVILTDDLQVPTYDSMRKGA